MLRFESLRAKAGASLLDVLRPGWAKQINLDALDLSNCSACVLGQLFGHFDAGLEKVFALKANDQALRHTLDDTGEDVSDRAGFSIKDFTPDRERHYGNLTRAWKREIAKRLAA